MKPTGNPVVDAICCTAEIGLTTTGAADTDTIAIIGTAPVVVSNTCPECGHPGKLRDYILRRLVDLLVVGFPNRLDVRVPRFLCAVISCPRKIFQTFLACADDGSELTHRVTRRILQHLTTGRMSIPAITKVLGTGRNLTNQVALDTCRQLAYDDPHHLDEVRILGADGHVWRYTQKPSQPSSLATILVDLAPLVDGRGPARLPDLHPGHSTEVLHTWLQEHDPSFRSQVQVVTMDGFTGYAFVVGQVPPDATKVMDPFHVVHLVASKLTGYQQRLQREIVG